MIGAIKFSIFLTYYLGIGVLLFGALYVWTRVIDLILPLFHFHKEFLAWIYEKNKCEVHPGTIKNPDFMKHKEDGE